jgi:hypothetical protein
MLLNTNLRILLFLVIIIFNTKNIMLKKDENNLKLTVFQLV